MQEMKAKTFTRPIYIRNLLLICMALVILSGCRKKLPEAEQVELLVTAHTWKFSKATALSVNISGFFEDCYKDNTLTFLSNKSGVMDEGPTRCLPIDPQTVAFTWSFEPANRKLIFSGSFVLLPGASDVFTLVRISSNELVLAQPITYSGVTQNVQITLVP